MTIQIYGIKNCDTMKKALAWLDEHKITYEFHDYKKEGADRAIIKEAITQHGWEDVINRKGTTWRALPEDTKSSMDEETALKAAIESPSIIKRPLLIKGKNILLGFDAENYRGILLA